MAQNRTTDVDAAFDMLIEEVEADIDFVNNQGARAFEGRDYDLARECLESVGRVTVFRDKIDSLRREWQQIDPTPKNDDGEGSHCRDLGRLRRGLRTPERSYYRPILQALAEMNGSASLNVILARVYQLMKDELKDVDHEPLLSEPEMPRWRNAAQWARNSMVKDGLLKSDSPRGTWEISDGGRRYLTEA